MAPLLFLMHKNTKPKTTEKFNHNCKWIFLVAILTRLLFWYLNNKSTGKQPAKQILFLTSTDKKCFKN